MYTFRVLSIVSTLWVHSRVKSQYMTEESVDRIVSGFEGTRVYYAAGSHRWTAV